MKFVCDAALKRVEQMYNLYNLLATILKQKKILKTESYCITPLAAKQGMT